MTILSFPSFLWREWALWQSILAFGALVPLLGGWLADTFREPRAPFLLAAGLIAVTIVLEEVLYRRRSRS